MLLALSPLGCAARGLPSVDASVDRVDLARGVIVTERTAYLMDDQRRLRAVDDDGAIVVVDLDDGDRICPLPLPDGGRAPFTDGAGSEASARAFVSHGRLIASWSSTTHYVGGVPPTAEMERRSRSASGGKALGRVRSTTGQCRIGPMEKAPRTGWFMVVTVIMTCAVGLGCKANKKATEACKDSPTLDACKACCSENGASGHSANYIGGNKECKCLGG